MGVTGIGTGGLRTLRVVATWRTKSEGKNSYALEIARIKEMQELKMIDSVSWCPSAQQLADTMTKRGASTEPIIHTISKGKFFF